MKRRMNIKAKDLTNGDELTASDRYKLRVRGVVKISAHANGIIFLSSPTLPDEDVAFRDGEDVIVLREVVEPETIVQKAP